MGEPSPSLGDARNTDDVIDAASRSSEACTQALQATSELTAASIERLLRLGIQHEAALRPLLDDSSLQVQQSASSALDRDRFIQELRESDPRCSSILSLGEVLDQMFIRYRELISGNVITIPVRIFAPLSNAVEAKGDGDSQTIRPPESGDKLNAFWHIMHAHHILPADILQYQETLEDAQMRAFPYHIFYLKTPRTTICISDQIGERTYVYRGSWISLHDLSVRRKREIIDGVQPIGVTYGSDYPARLDQTIFSSSSGDQSILASDVSEVSEQSLSSEDLTYHAEVLQHQDALIAAGVEFLPDGSLYCGRMKSWAAWLRLGGRLSISYPSPSWLRAHRVLTAKSSQMTNPLQFAEMLHRLGFAVVHENSAEENAMLKNELESQEGRQALIAAGVEFLPDGSLYCGRMKHCEAWSNFKGKSFAHYPSLSWLRAHSLITTKDRQMTNPLQFAEMLHDLGFKVIHENSPEENAMFKRELESPESMEALLTAGVEFLPDGSLYCGRMKNCRVWPKFRGKLSVCYPSISWLRAHSVLTEKVSQMTKPLHFAKMLHDLGFKVIHENSPEENAMFKNELESQEGRQALIAAGVEFHPDGSLHCERMKVYSSWPDFKGKSIALYPSLSWLRAHGIVTLINRKMTNHFHFAEMLRELKVRIVGTGSSLS